MHKNTAWSITGAVNPLPCSYSVTIQINEYPFFKKEKAIAVLWEDAFIEGRRKIMMTRKQSYKIEPN